MSRELITSQQNILKFIHITDTHLLNNSEDIFHGLNTFNNLERVLFHCFKNYPELDFLLFTGDISQTGTKASYRLFKTITDKFDLPIYCVPGNHDTPSLLQQVNPTCPNNNNRIIRLEKFSLVLLNSWVANEHHGMITQHCLQQFEHHLENSKDQFNIIALHHPPICVNSKWLDELGLKNQHAFLQIIKKYSQKMLLICGHIHQEVDQQLDNSRLLSTPSTCHQFTAKSEFRQHINIPSPAYRFVKLTSTNLIETKIHYV